MKTSLHTLLLIPMVLAASVAFGQEPAPGAPPPPPPAGVPVPPPGGPAPLAPLLPGPQGRASVAPPPPPGPAPVEQAAVLDGTVSQFLLNPDGDVDGLLLADGTQIKFPPHLGADLVRIAKANDKVRVTGFRESERVVRATNISNSNGGASVSDAPPAGQPPQPPAPNGGSRKLLQADGKVRVVLTAPRGEPEGAVLENGSILRMPPHIAAQYASLLQIGSAIAAKGFGTENQFGRSLEVTEIGAAGQPTKPIYDAQPATPPTPPRP